MADVCAKAEDARPDDDSASGRQRRRGMGAATTNAFDSLLPSARLRLAARSGMGRTNVVMDGTVSRGQRQTFLAQ